MFWNLLLSIGKLKYEHIELQSYLKGAIWNQSNGKHTFYVQIRPLLLLEKGQKKNPAKK